MSPEMLMNTYHTRMVDFYSLGAILYEMLTGLPPLYSNNRDEMYANIVRKEAHYPSSLSQEAIALLKGLLRKDPKDRLGAVNGVEDIKKSKFCSSTDWNSIMKKAMKNGPIKNELKS
jgi:serine/threonine protein kinase